MSTPYPLSAAPIALGRTTLANRLFVPAQTTNFGVDHQPSERHVQ